MHYSQATVYLQDNTYMHNIRHVLWRHSDFKRVLDLVRQYTFDYAMHEETCYSVIHMGFSIIGISNCILRQLLSACFVLLYLNTNLLQRVLSDYFILHCFTLILLRINLLKCFSDLIS